MVNMRYGLGFLMALFVMGFMGNLMSDGWSMDKKTYENVSVDQFVSMMSQKDFILINVHIPYQGEIAGTNLFIPFNALDQFKSELPTNNDAKIVVYCMSGPMGDIAAEKLLTMGYTEVTHFQGGMQGWKRAGKQLLYSPQ
jgi:rhodanese-related sulfurtransferase